MATDLLANLNDAQRAAVTHGDGPLLIVAGAGTGKTTVVTSRIAWLITQGKAEVSEVLALTFTDKAAGEMEERVDRLVPYGTVDLWVSTFHSFCQRILSAHALDIGIPGNIRLLNTTQQWLLVREHLDKFQLKHYRPLGNPTKFVHALLAHFARAKDEAVGPEEYLRFAHEISLNTDTDRFLQQILSEEERDSLTAKEIRQLAKLEIAKINEVADAYHTYQQLLLQQGAMDFGDLIAYTLKLLREQPKVLAQYRAQFRYLLVDEFQDTNWAQYELVKLLAAPRQNVTVVGDDDQAIYKFRGASVANILQFKDDFPKAKEIFLTTNYRSRQEILDASYKFIQLNNPERLEVMLAKSKPAGDGGKNAAGALSKQMRTTRGRGGTMAHATAASAEDEVRLVVGRIRQLKEKDPALTWSDFAILARANDHLNGFDYGLQREKIPYLVYASRGLYAKPVVLDIVNFLKLLDNYHESPAMYRVLCLPVFNVPQADLVTLNYWARRKAKSLYQIVREATAIAEINSEVQAALQHVLALIDDHTQLTRDKTVREVILSFLESSGYLKWISRADDPKLLEQVGYLNQFFRKVTEFEAAAADRSVGAFLRQLELELEAGEAGALLPEAEQGPDAVRLMTVHAAKGLEFAHVFLVNMVERRFPTMERAEQIPLPEGLIKERLPGGDVHLQEERRLFYVAVTRAKDSITFSSASSYGGTRAKKPSPFLSDLGVTVQAAAPKPAGVVPQLDMEAGEWVRLARGRREYYRMPGKFSYSQLKTYEICPWKYRFSFLLRVPVRGRPEFSFGQTIHAVLQRAYELVLQRTAATQGTLFAAAAPQPGRPFGKLVKLEELLQWYQDLWIDDWFRSPSQREQYFAHGKELIADYYAEVSKQVVYPKFLEQGFTVKLEDEATGRTHALYGKIDRVDEREGKLEITDYKTGTAKQKLSIEDKEQLLIYQLGAKEIFGKPIGRLCLYYLEGNVQQTFLGTEKDLERLRAKILTAIAEIERGEFVPSPGKVCAFCEYRDICEYRRM
ncbi:MAG: UvrD-helicase domain-containing protein [Patescibacteria group bacterium]|nr:UvrD-helicase domain-containing protein [Patescibacteria group bacterium]